MIGQMKASLLGTCLGNTDMPWSQETGSMCGIHNMRPCSGAAATQVIVPLQRADESGYYDFPTVCEQTMPKANSV